MRSTLPRRRPAAEEDEGYFVSMSDMLTGLLFVFIILLLFFAFQFRQTTEELTGANEARKALLKALEQELVAQKVDVEVDTDNGILRLRGVAMFEINDDRLTEEGRRSVRLVADALAKHLPCYTDTPDLGPFPCRRAEKQRVETLLIEGHTDAQRRGLGRDTNIDLSAMRAINTYLALIEQQAILDAMQTRNPTGTPQRIMSVSGYGPTRPLPGFQAPTPENFQRNRRIDLRFLMATPQSGSLVAELDAELAR
jgi:flagellar motor protein MotB